MFTYYRSPIGLIRIEASSEGICNVSFSKETNILSPGLSNGLSQLNLCVDQLHAYFNGKLKYFETPLNIKSQGTPFRHLVWRELCQIGYGQTISYKDLAVKIKHPKAYRAVGGANGANPISIIIPCHRVIQHDGNIGGYGGQIWRKNGF